MCVSLGLQRALDPDAGAGNSAPLEEEEAHLSSPGVLFPRVTEN